VFECTVNRIYKCDKEECGIEIAVTQSSSDPWIKICPNCKKESLYIRSGKANIGINVDASQPKTVGTLAEKNAKDMVKRGESIEPDMRHKTLTKDGYKYDFSILKNPKKYIMEGKK